jgi:hypothetical protein
VDRDESCCDGLELSDMITDLMRILEK